MALVSAHGPLLDGEDGGEEGEIAEGAVELPIMVGNLSPRMLVRHERIVESSVQALSIVHANNDVQNIQQVRGKGVRVRFPSDRQLRSTTSTYNSFQVLPYD